MRSLPSLVLLVALVQGDLLRAELVRGAWKPLFDGKSTRGWARKGGGDWLVERGVLRARGVTGDTRPGLLVSKELYDDFVVRLKVRLVKGNSGLMVRMDPRSGTAYEVEMDAALPSGDLFESNGRSWLARARSASAFCPDGWNTVVVEAEGHSLNVYVNGAKLTELANDPKGRVSGAFALQVLNGGEVMFKDIEVATAAQ